MSDIETTLATIIGHSFEESPELADIQKQLKAGQITTEEATRRSLEVLAQDPDVLAAIETMRPPGEGPKVRLPKIEPLVEAALIERAQFDGDMPELRFGPLPAGTTPSVPVQLTARNPVAGGRMIQQAATELKQEITRHEEQRILAAGVMIEKALPLMEAVGTALVKDDEPEVSAIVWGSPETDHPDYRRGQLPAPRKVAAPTGAELARLTPAEAREAAWTLLSTTHGRRSAQPVIEDLLVKDLRKRGVKVTAQPLSKAEKIPLATHEWTLNLSGKASTQPTFSFIDMASKVLSAGLRSKLPADAPELLLEVEVVSRLSDRVVGWAAWVFPKT